MAVVRKWGNSAAVRIPSSVLEAVHLTIDQPIEIRAEKGRIVIESALPTFDIDALVAAITPENMHGFKPHARRVGAEEIEW